MGKKWAELSLLEKLLNAAVAAGVGYFLISWVS